MTEENVTILVIKSLKKAGWKIISFDYPQSGTGKLIKPDSESKNLGGFIPDIVSFKDGVVLFWENKDRFVYEDFVKIKTIKGSNNFQKPIQSFLSGYKYNYIYYGISIPKIDTEIEKAKKYLDYVDFFTVVDSDKIDLIYKISNHIFI